MQEAVSFLCVKNLPEDFIEPRDLLLATLMKERGLAPAAREEGPTDGP
jgi:hypothetical protein